MSTMSELWTPSDELLSQDPIAQQKISVPFDPPELAAQGIVLPDIPDDETNELLAALALAELDDDDAAGDEPGDVDDDHDIEDPGDEPVQADI
jgi:hypothetical protein